MAFAGVSVFKVNHFVFSAVPKVAAADIFSAEPKEPPQRSFGKLFHRFRFLRQAYRSATRQTCRLEPRQTCRSATRQTHPKTPALPNNPNLNPNTQQSKASRASQLHTPEQPTSEPLLQEQPSQACRDEADARKKPSNPDCNATPTEPLQDLLLQHLDLRV